MGVLKFSFGINAYELGREGAKEFQGVNIQMNIDVETCKKCVKSGLSNTVADFDDHFEDCNMDWRNTHFILA